MMYSEYTAANALMNALRIPKKYPATGADRACPSHPPIWLVVAPTRSMTSAIHFSFESRRFRKTRKRSPVVTILRFPRIWYVAGSTYLRKRNWMLLWRT